MGMSVPDILAALRTQGIPVRNLVADSRAVEPGDVFLAYPGELSDGRKYIAAALERGAAAVVYEASGAEIGELQVPALGVENLRHVVAPLAAEVYGNPSRQLWLAGVTGTNGKTTTSWLIASILEAAGYRAGLTSTIANGDPSAWAD